MKLPYRSTVAVLTALLGSAAAAAPQDTICVDEIPLFGAGGSGLDYGRSVAVDGDLAIVCGDLEAYAYHWDGAAWIQEDILTIPGAESGFGASAALDGDTALIGLPLQDDAAVDTGRVLVFVRDGAGTWTLADELMAADAAANDQFGSAVALEGDRALIGAPRDDALGADWGSVYVFERTGSIWAQADKFFPAGGESVRFGAAVSLSGDTAVIGSTLFVGGTFVWVESGGVWSEQDELAEGLLLTGEVAVSGDRAVVAGLFNSLVFERSGSTWTETTVLPVTATTAAIDGDVIVLGGPSCPATPAVRVWVHDGGTWVESAGIDIAGSQMPVDIAGLRIVVGTRAGLSCVGGLASNFQIALDPPPSVAFRNAGTNPVSYSAVSASFGGTLEFTVDLSTTGHSMALIIGFDSPFGITLGGGQTLLCFDLLGSGGELINTGFFPGPIANISLDVPNDPVFAGFSVCTQAVHGFGVRPFALSNAQDIIIGGCP